MEYLQYFPILVILGAAVLVYALRNRPAAAGALPLIARPIMTDHELHFIEKLGEAVSSLGDLNVLPQVSMGAFLAVKPGTDKGTRASILNKVLKKRSDFILVDEASRVRLIVELDDATHNAARDAERDQLAAAAGIQTIRLRNGRKLTVQQIREALAPVLQPAPAR
jgi:hypothetical protein